ncbi:MAG: efflux RND transporter periplasmic adaptor subunit [Gammaproteobacteria bacterium]
MTRRFFLLIAALVLIGAGLYWYRADIGVWPGGRDRPPDTTKPAASLAAKVITQDVVITANDRVFETAGTGRARLSVQIYPAVAGEVTEVLFEAQDRVEKDQLLVQLDSRKEELAVRLAEVELRGAQNLLARYEQAVKDGGVPQSQVDSARDDVEAARVALDQARLTLEDRSIRAPFAGVVGIPNVEPGDRINTDTLITGLDDRRILHVDFEVSESLAGALQGDGPESRTITATTPAFPARVFTGTISARESRVDPQRRTFMVRANIENEEDRLRPGMSFSTRWQIRGHSYPTVPEIALQWGRDGSFVWIIRNGRAVRVPARVVARVSGRVLLDGDIETGEQVVIEGLQRLRPGAPVEMLGPEDS